MQEAEFYGASSLVFKEKKPFLYRASWVHGLGHMFSNFQDSHTILHHDEKFLPLHLVNTENIRNLLLQENYNSVAIGSPFIYNNYIDDTTISRSINRLFIPPHSIENLNTKKSYSGWISFAVKNNCDAICVSEKDFSAFSNINPKNVKIICGASIKNEKSLNKIAILFKRSKEIISSALGSHLAYAAICGAKVRLVLPDSIPEANIPGTEFYNNYIDNFPKESKDSIIKFLARSHAHNIDKTIWFRGNNNEILEYSRFICGVNCKKKKDEINLLLRPKNLAESLYIYRRLLANKFYRKLNFL